MKPVLCTVLLMTWGCMTTAFSTGPRLTSRGRAYFANEEVQEQDIEFSSSVVETRNLLAEVSNFLAKVADLSNHLDEDLLSSEVAATLLPQMVKEAYELKKELDANSVNKEEKASVDKVKNIIDDSLHNFAKKYSHRDEFIISSTTTTTTVAPPTTLNQVEDIVTELPNIEVEEPEVTTILAPTVEEEIMPQEKQNEEVFKMPEVVRTETLPHEAPLLPSLFKHNEITSFPVNSGSFLDIPPYYPTNAFNEAPSDTSYVRWMPDGGYVINYRHY